MDATDRSSEIRHAASRPAIGGGAGGSAGLIRRFAGDRHGATSIEYGLIAALIFLVIVGAITAIGANLSAPFTAVSSNL